MSAVLLDGQIELALDGPTVRTDADYAQLYWSPDQLAQAILHKPGSDGYREAISQAAASQRGHYGWSYAYETTRRGVEFRVPSDSAPVLVTWRRLWCAVRAHAEQHPVEAHTLFVAVVADRAARQRQYDEVSPVHRRTAHPTEAEQALIEAHQEATYVTYLAESDAVDAFWDAS